MTRENAKRHMKAVLADLPRRLTKIEKDAFTIAYNSMDKLDAIRKNTPDSTDWEKFSDKLWKDAYLRGVMDERERNKGKWITVDSRNCYKILKCSECGREVTFYHEFGCTPCDSEVVYRFPYCHCGVKMEVEE